MTRDTYFQFGDVVDVAVKRRGRYGYSPAVFFESTEGDTVAVHPIMINRTPLPIHFTDADRTMLATTPIVLPSRFLTRTGTRWKLEQILEGLDEFAILTNRGRPISQAEKERITKLSS